MKGTIMADAFPIAIPDRLPIRVERCPVVETIFQARFISAETWATLPGLLYAQVREKYTEQKTLPLAQVPEEFRRQDSALQHLPLLQFLSKDFIIQLGPRVVSLVTKANAYPGWPSIKAELDWLIGRIQAAGLVEETERLGVRFVDFFKGDVFPGLRLHLGLNDEPLMGTQTDVTTVLRRGPLAIRMRVTNGAIVGTAQGPKPGSVLDVDAWFGPPEVDLFENGLARFGEAHDTIKGLFFGLLKPELLATLKPIYE
jgi:uncharacterized protein (TIGR04255 family)